MTPTITTFIIGAIICVVPVGVELCCAMVIVVFMVVVMAVVVVGGQTSVESMSATCFP